MASHSTETGEPLTPGTAVTLPAFVDWILAAFVAIVGMGLVVGGSALTLVVDRALVREAIESGELVAPALTDAELLDVSMATANSTGIGLLVAGAGMVLFAVVFVGLRYRSRSRDVVNSYSTNALLGGVVTALFSFVPFSPVLGGGVAGYIERGESERTLSVGALAGLLPALPLLVVLVFVLVGVVLGLTAVGETGVAVVAGAGILVALLVVATVSAGAGALGGYVGGHLAEERTA